MNALNPKFVREVERIHACGPRAIGELLIELVAKIGAGNPELATFAQQRIDRYAALDPRAVHDLGGNRFPAQPIHLVKA